MRPRTRTCGAVGCQQTIRRPLLMCIDHWRMVPADLRRQVIAAGQRAQADESARPVHGRAVQAAIDAVHAKCLARQERKAAGTEPLF